jgi:hypothetical protein
MSSALERAVGSLARFLDERQIPYMVIGGIANLVWGEPRSTLDVDAAVLVEEAAWPGLIAGLRARFRVLPKDAPAFLRDTHVLPVEMVSDKPGRPTLLARVPVVAAGRLHVPAPAIVLDPQRPRLLRSDHLPKQFLGIIADAGEQTIVPLERAERAQRGVARNSVRLCAG